MHAYTVGLYRIPDQVEAIPFKSQLECFEYIVVYLYGERETDRERERASDVEHYRGHS
jgi:hypothetical protein